MAELPKPVSVASVAKPAPGKLEAAVAAKDGAPAQPAEAKEKKPKKAGTGQRGKTSALAGKVITLVEAKIREKMPEGRTELNPKREGTKGYKAFSLYKNGQTVAEFVKIASETKDAEGNPVGSLADVRWDSEHGFIELKDGPVQVQAPAAVPAQAETAAPAKVEDKK